MKLLVAVDLMKEPVYASSRNRAFIFTLVCKTKKKGKLKPVYFLRKGYYLVHSPDFLSLTPDKTQANEEMFNPLF